MEKNITAKKFFNQFGGYTREEMLKKAIEFAKYHVEKALIAASENSIKMSSTKDTVKNAYDLNNIK